MKRQLQDSRDYADRLRTQRSTLETKVARKSNEVSGLERKVGDLESKLHQCEKAAEQNVAKRLRSMIDSWNIDEVVSATPPEKPDAKDAAGDGSTSESEQDAKAKDHKDGDRSLPIADGPEGPDGPGDAAGPPEEPAVTAEGAPPAA